MSYKSRWSIPDPYNWIGFVRNSVQTTVRSSRKCVYECIIYCKRECHFPRISSYRLDWFFVTQFHHTGYMEDVKRTIESCSMIRSSCYHCLVEVYKILDPNETIFFENFWSCYIANRFAYNTSTYSPFIFIICATHAFKKTSKIELPNITQFLTNNLQAERE